MESDSCHELTRAREGRLRMLRVAAVVLAATLALPVGAATHGTVPWLGDTCANDLVDGMDPGAGPDEILAVAIAALVGCPEGALEHELGIIVDLLLLAIVIVGEGDDLAMSAVHVAFDIIVMAMDELLLVYGVVEGEANGHVGAVAVLLEWAYDEIVGLAVTGVDAVDDLVGGVESPVSGVLRGEGFGANLAELALGELGGGMALLRTTMVDLGASDIVNRCMIDPQMPSDKWGLGHAPVGHNPDSGGVLFQFPRPSHDGKQLLLTQIDVTIQPQTCKQHL